MKLTVPREIAFKIQAAFRAKFSNNKRAKDKKSTVMPSASRRIGTPQDIHLPAGRVRRSRSERGEQGRTGANALKS
jgi:hypothetical protein